MISAGGDNYFTTIASGGGGKPLAVAWFTNRHDPGFHNRQDVELATINPNTGAPTNRQRVTARSNETEADPILGGAFIGDYIQLSVQGGHAYIAYNASYRHLKLLGEGIPIPQQDNYLTSKHL